MTFVALFTFFVQNIFLGMFDEGVVAMLTCVAIDTDLHDGAQGFGPETFHNKVEKIKEFKAPSNKKNEDAEAKTSRL